MTEQEKDRRYIRRWVALVAAAAAVIVLSLVFTRVYPIVCFLEPWCGQ